MAYAKRNILIIDDSELVLDAAQLVLEESGFSVRALRDPAELQHEHGPELPDLVLLDANIPGYDGDELVRRVRRAVTSTARVILFSGAPLADLAGLARSGGADGFISKLDTLDNLPRRIAQILGAAE